MSNAKIQRVLVVGSWAKEEITIVNLKKNPQLKVYCYMDTRNPGIVQRVTGYRVGSLYDIEAITAYAEENQIDLTLVTTAAPLEAGLADMMESKGMKVFGPTKSSARLESDKAFTRRLIKKYLPHAVPRFEVFDNTEEAIDFARRLDWEVAVKPIGLTDGLGVKVAGQQLEDRQDIIDYIEEIHQKQVSGHSQVIIEEKLTGVEFTVQCFVYDEIVVPTPSVQDYKKLLNDEKGPNTASMGSYSDSGVLLPFMNRKDYDDAVSVVRESVKAFKQETGHRCVGFLYGQFMLCKDGIKLIEYNFRPGDPEWMNTVILLEDNIAEIVEQMMAGQCPEPVFRPEATVCKYITPPEYPYKLDQVLDVTVETTGIKKAGAELYWSCGLDAEGKLQVGTERGLALIASDGSIYEAKKKVEAALNFVEGKYHYRTDIGTPGLVKDKIEVIKNITGGDILFRSPDQNEFLEVQEFISQSPPLEAYPEHVFKILLRHFGNACVLAEFRGRIIGFVLGFISQPHDTPTYFLWQIGVAPYMQGSGLGKRLLLEVENKAKSLGCQRVELTIDPVNTPSQKLFEKCGYGNISSTEGEAVNVAGNLAVKDYYKPGRHFMLYEKKLH